MKKWGVVVTLLYAVIVVLLLVPATLHLAASSAPSRSDYLDFYGAWPVWVVSGVFVLGQISLLTLSVDTTQKRMRSRTPVVITALMTGTFLMVVTVLVFLSVWAVVPGEDKFPDLGALILCLFGIPWLVWTVLFYLLYRDSPDPVTRCVSWLFRGSVLELLVAVPSHVIVRRRHDCCAPAVTGFGITSGIAIMLMAFGPSVLLLFKKRMEKYQVKQVGS